MEYVQTVLVQVHADKIDEASQPQGLIAELDEHRAFLDQQPGFQDMRITRSINAEGNVLLVVETRWADDNSLVEYETGEPTVMSIINKHQDLIVADSLQVLDMEALRTETPTPADAAATATERLALPLMVPVGILAFALLVVYGLSRVYLEIDSDVATGLAAGIAAGILLAAWFFVSRPSLPAWQIASVGVLAAAVLTGGAIFAVVDDDEGEAVSEEPTADATPADGATPAPDGAPSGALVVDMGDNFFVFEGEQEPTIPVPAGEEISIDLENLGQAVHNMRIAGLDDEYVTDDDFVSDPDIFVAGDTGTLVFQIDQPGTFIFRCDFHPIEMVGEIAVQ